MQVLRAITNVTPAGSLQWFGPYKLLRAGSGFCQELVEDLWSYRLQEDAEFALAACPRITFVKRITSFADLFLDR